MKQDITLAVERDLLRKARVLAAQRGASLSGLLSRELARLVGEADRHACAKEQALQDLAAGYRLGGQPAPRDALHER